MKNLFLLSLILNIILSCQDQADHIVGHRIPNDTGFKFKQKITKTSSVGVKSKDKKTGFKIVINSIDKIEPKPYFFSNLSNRGKIRLPLEINIPLGEKFEKEIYFHPIFADKERLLDLKIYKDGKLLMTKKISYISVAYDDFKESGQNKGDILDYRTLFNYTYSKVKIDGKVEKEGLSRIKLNELEITIRNYNNR